MSLLVEKMPNIAMEGIEQILQVDHQFRKHYYYLAQLQSDFSFLNGKIPEKRKDRHELKEKEKAEQKLIEERGLSLPQKKMKTYARTPLEVGFRDAH